MAHVTCDMGQGFKELVRRGRRSPESGLLRTPALENCQVKVNGPLQILRTVRFIHDS